MRGGGASRGRGIKGRSFFHLMTALPAVSPLVDRLSVRARSVSYFLLYNLHSPLKHKSHYFKRLVFQ